MTRSQTFFLAIASITWPHYPASIYLFKVNNRNTRKKSEICSKSTIKTLERRP